MTYIEQLRKLVEEGKKDMKLRHAKYEGLDPFEPMDEEDERLDNELAELIAELEEKEGYQALEDMGIEY